MIKTYFTLHKLKIIAGCAAVFLGFFVLFRFEWFGTRNFHDSDSHVVISEKEHSIIKSEQTIKTASQTNYDDLEKELLVLRSKVFILEAELLRLSSSNEPKIYPKVKQLNFQERKRILVTGGAGFVGSHLVDALMKQGHEVTAIDNFFTGSKFNVEQWIGHKNFEIIRHDIVNPLYIEVDYIYHLASPASPLHYMENPVKTIKTNTLGTINMLGLARRVGARVLVASTSEVYGDPDVHPQSETYWGRVNPIGPRSCYDEGKRVAEALCYAYEKQERLQVRVARIFNTYGPRMHLNDGRVVSNFIMQAIQSKPITIYGSGRQTRSFQYVSDLIDGLISLMNSNYSQPVNLGNPDEYSIEEFASVIQNLVGGASQIIHTEEVVDDPQRRRPDITVAKNVLDWKPKVSLQEGLQKTVEYFRKTLIQEGVDAGSLTPRLLPNGLKINQI